MDIYKFIATLKNDRNIILHYLSRMLLFYLFVAAHIESAAGSSSADRGGADGDGRGVPWGFTTNQWYINGLLMVY